VQNEKPIEFDDEEEDEEEQSAQGQQQEEEEEEEVVEVPPLSEYELQRQQRPPGHPHSQRRRAHCPPTVPLTG